jgi:hypothetical protein
MHLAALLLGKLWTSTKIGSILTIIGYTLASAFLIIVALASIPYVIAHFIFWLTATIIHVAVWLSILVGALLILLGSLFLLAKWAWPRLYRAVSELKGTKAYRIPNVPLLAGR